MASIKTNISLNVINTVTGIIFPIITFPYAARVLLPDGIGIVNFDLSVINYIILIVSLGIPLYAVKEVAKYRDNVVVRNRLTVEIFLLSTLMCAIGYAGVWIMANYVPRISSNKALFYILSLSILFNAIGVNWFYQAIEDFKFITIRAVVIRCVAAASLYIFVRSQNDLLIYGGIVVLSTVGNNFINFIHMRKHISFDVVKLEEMKIMRHLKPALSTFAFGLITSLYVHLNSVMLGFMDTDAAVGYYTAGTKISHMTLTVITSLGAVLLPRCSHLIKSGQMEEFGKIIGKSIRLTLCASLPMTAGLMVLAYPLTILFCGGEFADAVPVLWWNAPIIIFIGLTNVMGIQVLFPMDKINLVLISVSGGAVVNLILNILLIPPFGATGASIAALAAEGAVLVLQLILGRKYYPFSLRDLFPLKYIVATIIMALVVGVFTIITSDLWLQLFGGIAAGVTVYMVALYMMRDTLFMETLSLAKGKLTHKKDSDEV